MRAALLILAAALTASTAGDAAEPKVTADGLHKVEASRVDLAYVRPEIEWSKYKTVRVTPLVISAAQTQPDDDAPILTEELAVDLQKSYADLWREELQREGYTLVESPRADTVVISSELTSIIASTPGPTPGTTPSGTVAVSIVMSDGLSRTTLATASDRKFARYLMHEPTRASDIAQVRDAFRNWAHILAQELRERADAPKVDLWACLNERKLCPPGVLQGR